MLTFFFLLILRTVATLHAYAHAYGPANLTIAYLRTPRGLKWAIPAALIAVPTCLYIASLMTALVDHGASKWLLLITFVSYVDASKFAALALWSPLMMLRRWFASTVGRQRRWCRCGRTRRLGLESGVA